MEQRDGKPRYAEPDFIGNTRRYPIYNIHSLRPCASFPEKIVTDAVLRSDGQHFGFPTDRFVHTIRDPESKAHLHLLAPEELKGKVHLVAERTGLTDKLGKPMYEAREIVQLPYVPPPSIKGNGVNMCV